jgi:hypothetical protein
MQKKAKSPKKIDLSNLTQEELLDFFHAILEARYELGKKGYKVSISKKTNQKMCEALS